MRVCGAFAVRTTLLVCLTLDVSLMQQGITALYIASQHGENDIVQLLLDNGASVDNSNKV